MDIRIFKLPEIAQYYSSPRISMLPLLDVKSLGSSLNPSDYSRFLEPDSIFLPSGRVALFYALKLSGVGALDEVLLPAYHCGSMIEPVLYMRAQPIFYNLESDLTYSLDDIDRLVTSKTKAIVLPHFFGFPQNIKTLKNWCEDRSIRLIEDCAHSFFGFPGQEKPGSVGDYAIASTVKFFPGTQGGALVCNAGNALNSRELRTPALFDELKTFKHTFEIARKFQSLKTFSYPVVNSEDHECVTHSSREMTHSQFVWFEPGEIGKSNTWFNRFVIRNSNYKKIINARRDNYRRYLELVDGIAGLTPLHREYENVIPYVFPVLLDNAEMVFPRLKLKGVPIWRWEELAVTDCNISSDYRHMLLQLPCHQSVTSSDIEWILRTIGEEFNS